ARLGAAPGPPTLNFPSAIGSTPNTDGPRRCRKTTPSSPSWNAATPCTVCEMSPTSPPGTSTVTSSAGAPFQVSSVFSTTVVKICLPPGAHALELRSTCPRTTASADAVKDSTSPGPSTVAASKTAISMARGYYGIAPPPSSRKSQAATRQPVTGSICTAQALPQAVSKNPGP